MLNSTPAKHPHVDTTIVSMLKCGFNSWELGITIYL